MTDDERWAAVIARDPAADDDFVFSVTTTGVYCRPSCAARRPRRDHVAFHAGPADAEQAGFRACRRCRPDDEPAAARRASAMAAACRTIDEAAVAPSIAELADGAGMGRSTFQRAFKAVTGVTPKAYAVAVRRRRVQDGLADPESTSVTEAVYGAGFGSGGRFYATSKASLGMTPSAFRRGGPGETIRFAVSECSLGWVLVGATDQGVCSIILGDDPEELVRHVEKRFAAASLLAGDEGFGRLVSAVLALIDDPGAGLDLELDLRGTAFQQRVWQALREIAPGSTATYGEVAAAIGRPEAARAVAAACGANPIAIAVPCHRVVRADGSLSGYRWGVERKRALLECEARS